MQLKHISFAAMAATASAQSLASVLGGAAQLSNLTTYLGLYPTFENALGSMTNITLLAPNNEAFAKALNSSTGAAIQANDTATIQALFSYHVLQGTYSNFSSMPDFVHTALNTTSYSNVTGGQVVEAVGGNSNTFYSGLLQNSTTNGTTVNFTGGVIHIIDEFLTIPLNVSESAIQLGLSSAVGALEAAGLVDTLDGLSDVTVFVPNNEAFQRVASAIATADIMTLTSVLEYHVINGTVAYSTLLSNTTIPTLNGDNVTISLRDNSVFVNGAEVIVPNVLVGNGVVHVIDNVLNPMNSSSASNMTTGSNSTYSNSTATAGEPQFSGATSTSVAPFTSGVATPTSSIATPTIGAASGTAASTGTGMSSSSSGVAAAAMKTGAVGAAALFGGAAAAILNM